MRGLDRLYLAAAWAGAACVVVICFMMLAQAVLRLSGTMVRGADDVTAWMCAGAAFLPLAATFKRGELVRMGFIVDRLHASQARRLELVALALCLAFAVYLAHALGSMVYESFVYNDLGQGLLPIPIWIPQMPVAVGALILAIALADEFVRVVMGAVPSYVEHLRTRHAAGDYSGEI